MRKNSSNARIISLPSGGISKDAILHEIGQKVEFSKSQPAIFFVIVYESVARAVNHQNKIPQPRRTRQNLENTADHHWITISMRVRKRSAFFKNRQEFSNKLVFLARGKILEFRSQTHPEEENLFENWGQPCPHCSPDCASAFCLVEVDNTCCYLYY